MNPAEYFWALEVARRYLSMARVDLVATVDMVHMVDNLDMVDSVNIVDSIGMMNMQNNLVTSSC